MKKIVIAGGTGFLGSSLVDHWKDAEVQIFILTRRRCEDYGNVHYVKWDGKHLGYWTKVLEGADVLINLNGKSVDCRYTQDNKELIYDTRIDATYILGKAVEGCINPPKLWINAASATIYRHAEDKDMDEQAGEIGTGFSVDVCKKWEASFKSFQLKNTRQVIFRIGIVLGEKGGPLKPLLNLAKIGFGGRQGSGKQFFSWIHVNDFVRAFDFIISREDLDGTFNLTGPRPVRNYEMMHQIRRLANRRFGLPMPKWLLEIGAIFIRTETELILKSRRVVPRRLLEEGFEFYQSHTGLLRSFFPRNNQLAVPCN